ncbi:MAG: hypothetical protein J7K58_05775 [Euryarchaeota archaeon]|nr:hypothetical protein [Euryarchaeota archaeon]
MEKKERIIKLTLMSVALVIVIAGIIETGYAIWDKKNNVAILIEVPKNVIKDRLESAYKNPDNVTVDTTYKIYLKYKGAEEEIIYESNATYVFKDMPELLLVKISKESLPRVYSGASGNATEGFSLGVKIIVRPRGFTGNNTLEMTYSWEAKYTYDTIPSTIKSSPQ